MLPDFPEFKKVRNAHIMSHVYTRAYAKRPLLEQIPRYQIWEGDNLSSRSVDGYEHGGLNEAHSSGKIDTTEMLGYTDEDWVQAIETQLIGPLCDQQEQMFIDLLNTVTERTGNVISNEGKGVTEDLIIDMYDKMLPVFDSDGNPVKSTFVGSKEFAESLKKLAATEEGMKKYGQIVERKRIEWRLGAIDRKLVD